MPKIRRILLPVHNLQAAHRTVLRKAAALARATGATIELFHAAEELASAYGSALVGSRRKPSAPARGPDGALHAAQRRLGRLARSPLLRGCRVGSFVVSDFPPHEAIVRRAIASRADLVVAGVHRPQGLAARLLLRNTDWELIRSCPCPLLLVKSRRAYREPRILVAVDPFHAHAKPARLDDRLLSAGRDVAHLLHGAVHLFHAYMPLLASVEGPLGEPIVWESAEIENVHRAQILREFDRLADRAGIARSRRHLALGDVPAELCSAVRRTGAALVVMGAVSRSGLRSLFIGGTAERVLDRLACDVLVIKPRGFKTAVPQGRL